MTASKPLRVLLVKPFQPAPLFTACQPPAGILALAGALRQRFGERVEVAVRDMRLFEERAEVLAAEVAGAWDLVGISALNCEARAAHALAGAIRARAPESVLALGGPYGRSMPEDARAGDDFDLVFTGEADRTFPRAVAARFFGDGALAGIPGLCWRPGRGAPWIVQGGEDRPEDLGALPLPTWDLVPFDIYAKRHNMNGTLRAKRYAPLVTSRGCPYRCTYCHDLFGKRVRARPPQDVLAEIEVLHDRYGVGDFHIIDDIFNLDRARMRAIAQGVIARFGRRKLGFVFPNGVRGDLLDPADLPLLRDMGVYDMAIAVETASPRLQRLLHKNLDLEKVRAAIAAADAAGITVKGFFMVGFPTETRDEITATFRFAQESRLTIANFFFVIPQPGTALHDLAREVLPVPPDVVLDYYSATSWYELAYGVDLARLRRDATLRFYLQPRRILRCLRRININQLFLGDWALVPLLALGRQRRIEGPVQGADG